MATKSTFTRLARLKKTVAKYAELRKQLKKEGNYAALMKLPRDASPTRLRNICSLTGRSRGNYKKFKVSRLMLRKLALEGVIPGMRKASW